MKEFEWFILAFLSSWLMSIFISTPLIYILMELKDIYWDGLSDRGKIHVSNWQFQLIHLLGRLFFSLHFCKNVMRMWKNTSKKLMKIKKTQTLIIRLKNGKIFYLEVFSIIRVGNCRSDFDQLSNTRHCKTSRSVLKMSDTAEKWERSKGGGRSHLCTMIPTHPECWHQNCIKQPHCSQENKAPK